MTEEIVTECPYCGSKSYFQPKDVSEEGIYPILECKDCGKRWWSD